MIRDVARTLGIVATAAVVMVGTTLSAQATTNLIPNLWPASSAELGTPKWTGFIISPEFNFTNSFDVTGSAASGFGELEGHHIGGRIGYDYQFGNLLVGGIVEGAWGTADDDGSGAFTGFEADLKSIGTVRGRIGVIWDRFLIYGTGGAAFGELRLNSPAGRQEETLTGWIAGGGIEYMWNEHRSIRFEFTHLELEEENFGGNTLGVEGQLFDFGFIRRF